MPLSQTARSHHLARQKKSLTLCLSAAIAAHGLLFIGWSLDRREQQQNDAVGVEFVYLDPAVSAIGNSQSDRRAQIDAVAGGTRNEASPVRAGRTNQSAAPSPISEANQPLLPENRSTPANSGQAPSQQPAPAQTSAAMPSPRSDASDPPQPAENSRPTRPEMQTPAQPAEDGSAARSPAVFRSATPPRPASSAAPNTPPITPQTGQGLDGQINPDRTTNGNGSIDATADDRWGTYMATLNQQVDQHWQRIGISASRRAQVRFEIDRSGQLIAAHLVQSSGDPAADNAALEAIRLAAPFSPFPDRTTEPRLNVTFTFNYYPASQPAAN